MKLFQQFQNRMKLIFVLLIGLMPLSAHGLTFKSGESISSSTTDKAQDASDFLGEVTTDRPLSGIVIENRDVSLNYPPVAPRIIFDRYWFGYFWRQHDFNNDGHLDFLYTGTMRPDNVDWGGEDTGGLCGGGACTGQMPSPSLFLNDGNGAYILSDELFADSRKISGFSLARQNLVADFNNDGILDLFVADHAVGTHNGIRDSYYLSQPDGTWTESSETHLSHPNYRIFDHGGAVGDIDQDGDMDIVLTELKAQLTCWMNDGFGKMTKRKCGAINAFAIELGDMDGDGDLDIVHAGHEGGGSSPTSIAFNNGRGIFKKSRKLPIVKNWSTVPEISLWDLDGDTDLDIVLSRSGKLYVGTGVQIIENKGSEFISQFIPIIEAPADYVPVHEGNEWNNFIENFLFKDVDEDGDPDIILVGHGSAANGHLIAGSVLRNEGGLRFIHIPNGRAGNPVIRLPDILFAKDAAGANWLDNFDITYSEAIDDDAITLPNTLYFGLLDSKLVAVSNLALEKNGYHFTGIFNSNKGYFKIAICSQYYDQFNFFSTRIGFDSGEGFGGDSSLQSFGTHECLNKEGYVGNWETEQQVVGDELFFFLEEVNNSGRDMAELIIPLVSSDSENYLAAWLN